MPNTKSAIKRVKKTNIQTSFNRIRKVKYKAAIKKMSSYLSSGKTKEAKNFLPKFHSELMKVAKTGIVKRETVSRKISRVAKKLKNYQL